MAAPDRSFAQPAHMLASTAILPGPGVTQAAAGGQAVALDPSGKIPTNVWSPGHEFVMENGTGLTGTSSSGGSYITSLPTSLAGAGGESAPVMNFDQKVTTGLTLQISGRFTALEVSGTGRGSVKLGVETTSDLHGSSWTAYDGPDSVLASIVSNGQTIETTFDWLPVTDANFSGLLPATWLRVVLRVKHTVSQVRGQNAFILGRWA